MTPPSTLATLRDAPGVLGPRPEVLESRLTLLESEALWTQVADTLGELMLADADGFIEYAVHKSTFSKRTLLEGDLAAETWEQIFDRAPTHNQAFAWLQGTLSSRRGGPSGVGTGAPAGISSRPECRRPDSAGQPVLRLDAPSRQPNCWNVAWIWRLLRPSSLKMHSGFMSSSVVGDLLWQSCRRTLQQEAEPEASAALLVQRVDIAPKPAWVAG